MELAVSNETVLGIIVFFSYTAQSISGFGSTVIAVTLGAHLFPLPVLIPSLVLLDLLLNGFLSMKYFSDIDFKLLWADIIPFMAAGVAAGLILFDILAGGTLKHFLGLFVMVISLKEASALLKSSHKNIHPLAEKVFFTLAGIIHGMYAAGGPLVVYAASRLNLGKTAFRAVLTTLWSILSTLMTLFYIQNGQWTAQTGRLTLLLMPFVAAGLVTGDMLHKKLSENSFRLFIYILLFFAGASLLL